MHNKIERIKSGIPGLDKLIEGGFIRGHTILLCGSFGTGKSSFGMQYLVEGAKAGENGLFISFEEEAAQLKEEASSYGWDIQKLEHEKKLKIMKIAPIELYNLVEAGYGQVGDVIKSMKISRIVVDSIVGFETMGKDEYDRRKYVLDFVGWLKKNNCTAIITADKGPDEEACTNYGIAESAADGIIILYHPKEKNKRTRSLEILKMRETKHANLIVAFNISDKGLSIGTK